MLDDYIDIKSIVVPEIGDLYRSDDNYICEVCGVWHLWDRSTQSYYSVAIMITGYPTVHNFNIKEFYDNFTKIEF